MKLYIAPALCSIQGLGICINIFHLLLIINILLPWLVYPAFIRFCSKNKTKMSPDIKERWDCGSISGGPSEYQ